MKFKTIIFDLDGTLVDSLPVISSTIVDVLSEFDLVVSIEEVKKLIGLPTEDIFNFFIKDTAQRDFAVDLFDNRIPEHTVDIKIFHGIMDLLLMLSRSNANMSIYTSRGKESAMLILEQNKIDVFFDFIISRDDVKNLKPNPEGIFKIIDHFNISNSEVLFIGDSTHDQKAGTTANVETLIIDSGKNYFSDKHGIIKLTDLEKLYDICLDEMYQWK